MSKRLFKYVFSALIVVISSTTQIYADSGNRDEFPVQVQLLFNNIGSGVLIGNNFNSNIYAGFEVTSKSVNEKFSGVSVSGDFPTAQFNIRYSAWDDSGFFLQLGAVFYDWTIEGKGEGFIDNYYTTSEILKVSWSGVSPSLGIGWNWIGEKGFSGSISLSSFSLSSPTISVEDGNSGSTVSEAQIQIEEKDAEERFNNINTAFLLGISLGWNF